MTNKKMEELRKQLNEMILQNSLNYEELLKISQKLDRIILEFMNSQKNDTPEDTTQKELKA